ncbi:MAG TPA: GGDEF domain-containing protein [Streptosporangiaceae bacterium]|nr:GGDEF domain-containing protein [Streptosporangiaceae bacterium]
MPRWPRAYVIAVPGLAAAAIGIAAARTSWHLSQVGIFFLLVACAGAMVEATRDVKLPRDTLTRDLQEVWYLAVALLLPPIYALLVPIPLVAMKQWRVRQNLLHRRLFSVGAIGLGYGVASAEFHSLFEPLLGGPGGAGAHTIGWLGATIGAGLTGWLVNVWLIVGAVKLTDPAARVRAVMFSREAVMTDTVITCMAALVAFALSFSLVAIIVALPVVLMQKRVLMHAQLVTEARTDAKTGLLNAAAWQGESATELSRAKRHWPVASVAIIDIDHFKAVNDTYGHLAGDQVLRVIADRFTAQLRDGDLIGRFGGEEFAVLLPHTAAAEAARVAERLRAHIADEPVAVGDGRSDGILIGVTVSVGVAELGDATQDLVELLAAADAALYAAKSAGRNRICVGTPELARTRVPAPRDRGPAVGYPQ